MRDQLALRDLPEMFPLRALVFTQEAVRDVKARLAHALVASPRGRRHGKAGHGRRFDAACVKVHRQWAYLHQAIDRSGALVDVVFSDHRDMAAATAFVEPARRLRRGASDRGQSCMIIAPTCAAPVVHAVSCVMWLPDPDAVRMANRSFTAEPTPRIGTMI